MSTPTFTKPYRPLTWLITAAPQSHGGQWHAFDVDNLAVIETLVDILESSEHKIDVLYWYLACAKAGHEAERLLPLDRDMIPRVGLVRDWCAHAQRVVRDIAGNVYAEQ
ncbi:Short-chain dehydrogenase/reductase SDR [Penicillium canariense]|uniref:Short-chain dehydrogenase/reductase SDR n=1 Tax=Penicillium canariense TaxID=189055 RepID=A0A9W9IFR4_9EURO|nr:Short-chain dehydrogenase/reductase SDR [Penicillium canariense]KAJ5174766.1 Short-chain dehydrogenase/reductase SDR [Penicillium canariense]